MKRHPNFSDVGKEGQHSSKGVWQNLNVIETEKRGAQYGHGSSPNPVR